MRKLLTTGVALFIILFISGFLIPITLHAPPDARVIVDHTNQTVVAPPCFNDADVSNYLQETNFKEAQELGYEPASACTDESLKEANIAINIALLKMAGLSETKWDDETIWE